MTDGAQIEIGPGRDGSAPFGPANGSARTYQPVKWRICKYCGARLRRDSVGQYCPTKNCQWHHGLPASEDTPR